jgi:hypothetical protein
MAIDYLIGFTEKPIDLEPFLLERNYQLKRTQELPGEMATSTYRFFDNERSKRGVEVVYQDSLEPDDQRLWDRIAPQAQVAASAKVSTYMRRSRFDQQFQRETAVALRNRYGALLFDPQMGKLIHDIHKLTGEGALLTYPIDVPGWYASQWNSRSVAIFSGSNPQPIRIIERPESWGDQWGWNLCDEGIYFQRGEDK